MGQALRKVTVRRERPLRRVRILGPSPAIRRQKESLLSIRIAVYSAGEDAPLLEDIASDDVRDLLDRASRRAHELAWSQGGTIPFVAIREIVANLVHARCRGAIVSIVNQGRTIVVSDQGMGIGEKDRAVRAGFSTATPDMRQDIAGVGSGFAVAAEAMDRADGTMRIEDNIGTGVVVTLDVSPADATPSMVSETVAVHATLPARIGLSDRQARVLLVVAENGGIGPTVVAKELAISLATAHRDLDQLEKLGFVQYVGKGKRALTPEGQEHIDSLFHE